MRLPPLPQVYSLLTDALSSILQNTVHSFSSVSAAMAPPVMTPVDVAASFRRAAHSVEVLIKSIENNRSSLPAVVRGLREDLVPLVPLLNQVASAVKSSDCELALGHDAQYLLHNCERICLKHSNNVSQSLDQSLP